LYSLQGIRRQCEILMRVRLLWRSSLQWRNNVMLYLSIMIPTRDNVHDVRTLAMTFTGRRNSALPTVPVGITSAECCCLPGAFSTNFAVGNLHCLSENCNFLAPNVFNPQPRCAVNISIQQVRMYYGPGRMCATVVTALACGRCMLLFGPYY